MAAYPYQGHFAPASYKKRTYQACKKIPGKLFYEFENKQTIETDLTRVLARNLPELAFRLWNQVAICQTKKIRLQEIPELYFEGRLRGPSTSLYYHDQALFERSMRATFIPELYGDITTPKCMIESRAGRGGYDPQKALIETSDVCLDEPIQDLLDYASSSGFLTSPVRNHVRIKDGVSALTLFIRSRQVVSHWKLPYILLTKTSYDKTWTVQGVPQMDALSDSQLMSILVPELRSMR